MGDEGGRAQAHVGGPIGTAPFGMAPNLSCMGDEGGRAQAHVGGPIGTAPFGMAPNLSCTRSGRPLSSSPTHLQARR
jgi:hypothetical protein